MCAWIKVAGNHVREAFGTAPGLFRTVQLNCSLLMSRFMKHSFYGCAPQVVLAVPQEVKLQAAMSTAPVGAVTRTVVGGLKAVLASHVTPTSWLPTMVDSDMDLGVAREFWMRIPPKTDGDVAAPLSFTVVSLISKPAPLRRMPPAVLLLTLT